MNITSLQKKLALIISIFTIVGGLFTATVWLSSVIVTKDDLMLAVTDINLRLIDESIARYHSMGLDNLNDVDKHRYEKLLLAEQANDKQRRELLGL